MTDETLKKKATTITAIMNNTKLSKAVIDGLNAPIGSSKRSKAVAILGAFNKGDKQQSQVLDGKGGMPDNSNNMATLYGPAGSAPKIVHVGSQEASDLQSQGWGLTAGSYQETPTIPKKKVIIKEAPAEKPMTNISSTEDSQWKIDFPGTTALILKDKQNNYESTADKAYNDLINIGWRPDSAGLKIFKSHGDMPKAYQKTIDSEYTRLIEEGFTQEKAHSLITKKYKAVSTQYKQAANEEYDKLIDEGTDPTEAENFISNKYGVPPTSQKYQSFSEYNKFINLGYTHEAAVKKTKEMNGIVPEITSKETLINDESSSQNNNNNDDNNDDSQKYDDSDLSEADKEFIKLAKKYGTSGFSAQTAANLLMNNTALLRKIGISEELLPIHGASLAGQISDLAETLKQKTGLEMAENNLTKLQERGMTITDDLTAYIKGRDKYIKNINNMINKADAYKKTIDMSLPENQRSMKNYSNYLRILKGRQQQRYIDFLNTGINYHNAELKRATNSYNDTYKRFNSELSTQTAITKENYERLNNMLMDMYNNIVNREKITREKELEESKAISSKLQAAKDLVELNKILSGTSDSGWNQLTDNAKAQAKAQYIASNDGNKSILEAKFNSLPDADKLSWTTNKNKNNAEYVDYYVEKVLNDEIEGNLSDYYDDETGLSVYKNIPNNNNLRTQVEMEVDRIRPLLTIKNEKTKGMTPLEKIRYYLGK